MPSRRGYGGGGGFAGVARRNSSSYQLNPIDTSPNAQGGVGHGSTDTSGPFGFPAGVDLPPEAYGRGSTNVGVEPGNIPFNNPSSSSYIPRGGSYGNVPGEPSIYTRDIFSVPTPTPYQPGPWVMPPDSPPGLSNYSPTPFRQGPWVMPPDDGGSGPGLTNYSPAPFEQGPWVMPDESGPGLNMPPTSPFEQGPWVLPEDGSVSWASGGTSAPSMRRRLPMNMVQNPARTGFTLGGRTFPSTTGRGFIGPYGQGQSFGQGVGDFGINRSGNWGAQAWNAGAALGAMGAAADATGMGAAMDFAPR